MKQQTRTPSPDDAELNPTEYATRDNQFSLYSANPESDAAPFNPYYAPPHTYFATASNLDHNITTPDPYNSASETNFAPLDAHLAAPYPPLAISTLESMAELYRDQRVWRQRRTEARTSARSQPYDLMARPCLRPSGNDSTWAQQVGFVPGGGIVSTCLSC
jgi:hypothetical protein